MALIKYSFLSLFFPRHSNLLKIFTTGTYITHEFQIAIILPVTFRLLRSYVKATQYIDLLYSLSVSVFFQNKFYTIIKETRNKKATL